MDGPTLIADALVITCDPQDTAGRMSILVRDGRIAGLAPEAESLLELHPEPAVIDARQMLVVPGFVNAHVHPESLLFRDLGPQAPGIVWKPVKIFPQWAAYVESPEFHDGLLATDALAAVRHLHAGVTTVGRSLPPVEAQRLVPLLEADRGHGLRTVTTVSTWQQIAEITHLAVPQQCIAVSLGREEEFTASHLATLVRVAREQGARLMAAVGEVKEDADLVRRKFKKGLLALLRDLKILDPSLQLVHLNHGTAEDVQLAARNGVTITLTPRAAAAKRTGYPLLRHLGAHPVTLCLGTDWGETDIMREMAFMSDLPLLFPGMRPFSPPELLRMATINGARALGLESETGSIEQGKRADLVFFRLQPTAHQYLEDVPTAATLASALLHQCAPSDIVRVMADGTTLCADGSCTMLDEAAIVARFRRVHGHLAETFFAVPPAAEKTKSVPFVPSRVSESEPYEEGFTIVGKFTATASPAPASAPPAEPPETGKTPSARSRDVRKPELSKNVRRVFGEDDDPIKE